MARKLINIDEMVGDPIMVQIDGVQYPVKDLSTTEYLQMLKMSREAEKSENKTEANNQAMIEQVRVLLPTYPWTEKPMKILAVMAIIQVVTDEMGEAMAGRMFNKPTPLKIKK